MNLLHATARTSDSAVHASMPYVAFSARSIGTWTEQCDCRSHSAAVKPLHVRYAPALRVTGGPADTERTRGPPSRAAAKSSMACRLEDGMRN
jgi:hypothetical protein